MAKQSNQYQTTSRGVAAYVRNKEIRKYKATFVITPFESYWRYNGRNYTDAQFNTAFPVGLINKSKHGIIDGRSKAFFD